MLCSRLHCQKSFELKRISYKIIAGPSGAVRGDLHRQVHEPRHDGGPRLARHAQWDRHRGYGEPEPWNSKPKTIEGESKKNERKRERERDRKAKSELEGGRQRPWGGRGPRLARHAQRDRHRGYGQPEPKPPTLTPKP